MSRCPNCKKSIPFLKRFLNELVCENCKARLAPDRHFARDLLWFNLLVLLLFFLTLNLRWLSAARLFLLYCLVVLPVYIFWYAFRINFEVYRGKADKGILPNMLREVRAKQEALSGFMKTNNYILGGYVVAWGVLSLVFRVLFPVYFIIALSFGLVAAVHMFSWHKLRLILVKILERRPLDLSDEYYLTVSGKLIKYVTLALALVLCFLFGWLYLWLALSEQFAITEKLVLFSVAVLGVGGGLILIYYLIFENRVIKVIEQIKR